MLFLRFLESNMLSKNLTILPDLYLSLHLSLVLSRPVGFSCFLVLELYKLNL